MKKIEISHRTIIFTVLFLLFLKFIWVTRELVFSLFIAFIIMSALKPPVAFLERKRIPRLLASVIVYILFLGFIIELLLIVFPPLIKESTLFFKQFPQIIETASPQLKTLFNFDSLTQNLPNLTASFFDLIGGIFSNTLFVISTLFFGFYFLLEEGLIKKLMIKFFDESKTSTVVDVFNKAEKRMSAWVWGELILMTIVGLLTFFGLSLIGTRFSLALAVLAGLLEVVPNIGPVLSAIPAILIGLSQSYFLGVANIVLYLAVQQFENQLIVPLVMKKVTGLNPIVTLSVLIIGGKLAGALGVILAIPTTLFIETVLIGIIKARKETPRPTVNLR